MTMKLHVEEETPRLKRDGPISIADQVDAEPVSVCAGVDAVGPGTALCLVSDRRSARDWESFDRRSLDPRCRCRALSQ
jgi:hypothetical protein